ncbi:hypothetical protein D8Y23_08940 [Microbacterium enclense]|uniref:Major capsid protein n=1 Tax=Microbacterium enclense TaxID=993073 RepID=A0A3S3MY33_9MICO|nr:hypothetical protein [Microbacterium enclense]RWR18884.1 hypothetical protein D8Y23_08940 [Microbacterium enclense]
MESRLKIAVLGCDIVGADRGFNVAADILTNTADGVPLNNLWREFSTALAEWNKTRDAISALFTRSTTESFAQLPVGSSNIEFEKQSEFGVPQSSRVKPDYTRMGFPLEWSDAGLRYTRKFLRDATADQVRAQHQAVLEADNRATFRDTMTALTTKAQKGTRTSNENGVEVFDLWDGSAGETPPSYAGRSFSSTHDHYLVSGATLIDSGDIEALITTIQEHGHGLRESGEQLIIMVNPAQMDPIATWRKAEANANGAVAKYDFIPASSAPAYLTDLTIIGDRAPAAFNGLPLEGSYGDAWITKSYFVPAGYVIAVATGGANSLRNPLWLREHPTASSRGLRLLPQYERYPLVEATYEHGYGLGVRYRSAAAVMQIKASGSYDNPTWP